jgi:hypothetical protein
VNLRSRIQEIAFQIAKRSWLKRSMSLASCMLGGLSVYHQVQVEQKRVHHETVASSSGELSEQSSSNESSNRSPASVAQQALGHHTVGDAKILNEDQENSSDQNALADSTQTTPPQQRVMGVGSNPATPQYGNDRAPASAGGSSANTSGDTSAPATPPDAGTAQAAGGFLSSLANSPTTSATTTTTGTSSSGSGSPTVGTSSQGPTPQVTAVSPVSGPATGGTLITITGSNFVQGASVQVGGSVCAPVTFVSAAQLTCLTSLHSVQSVSVIVTNPSNLQGTLAYAFNYQASSPFQSVMFAGGHKNGAYGDTSETAVTSSVSIIIAP